MKILVMYDIAQDKLRTKFSKFLSKFGRRLQYSVFEIKNSDRLLNIITAEINNNYGNRFEETDSVIIYRITQTCDKISFGYAKHDDEDLIIL